MDILTQGERITLYRQRAGMTKKALAEKVGVSAATLSKYEDDKLQPDDETLNKIAVELEKTVEEIVWGF